MELNTTNGRAHVTMANTMRSYLYTITLATAVLSLNQYECERDGIPLVRAIASRGASPAVELFIPLYASCSDLDSNIPIRISAEGE
jgi:hypothetical protein